MSFNNTLDSGYSFEYSIDYPGEDFGIGGGYTPYGSSDPVELMFEDPYTSGSYTFTESTSSITLYIMLPNA